MSFTAVYAQQSNTAFYVTSGWLPLIRYWILQERHGNFLFIEIQKRATNMWEYLVQGLVSPVLKIDIIVSDQE